jgi:hypothetical protein
MKKKKPVRPATAVRVVVVKKAHSDDLTKVSAGNCVAHAKYF